MKKIILMILASLLLLSNHNSIYTAYNEEKMFNFNKDVIFKVALVFYGVLVMYGIYKYYKKIKTMRLKERLKHLHKNILPILVAHNNMMTTMNINMAYRPCR